jgi:hypothetical protein
MLVYFILAIYSVDRSNGVRQKEGQKKEGQKKRGSLSLSEEELLSPLTYLTTNT